jgi:uncharacterized RmlC-like cupin family protein
MTKSTLQQISPEQGQDWRTEGIRVVHVGEKSCDTPSTLGMNRQVAISGSRVQSKALWAGTNRIEPGSATGPHHHGELESVIYVIRGHAFMRWGNRLEWITKAGPGDFLLVPAYLPHQELNASSSEELHCVIIRSGTEEIVVNLDLDPVAEPEWVD